MANEPYKIQMLLALVVEAGGQLTLKDVLSSILFIKKETNVFLYSCVARQGQMFSYTLNRDIEKGRAKKYLELQGDEVVLKEDSGALEQTFLLKEKDKKLVMESLKYNAKEYFNLKRPRGKSSAQFITIGYESVDVDAFFKKLQSFSIDVLADVRKNPVSRKFGFSKSVLQSICNDLSIEYMHCPSLGIDGADRKELRTRNDYMTLFIEYEKKVLAETQEEQKKLEDIIKRKRTALMCFEADSSLCHRSVLARSIVKHVGLDVKHARFP